MISAFLSVFEAWERQIEDTSLGFCIVRQETFNDILGITHCTQNAMKPQQTIGIGVLRQNALSQAAHGGNKITRLLRTDGVQR